MEVWVQPENKMYTALSFDDVLLEPQFSEIESRSIIDIGNHLGNHYYALPVISAPMDTVTEVEMAKEMVCSGGLGIIHRYNTIDAQVKLCKELCKGKPHPQVGAAIGVTGDYLERAQALIEAGVEIICVDVAHGHHSLMKDALKILRQKFYQIHIMAGNVATPQAFRDLANWGANSIKVGIGGGSICSTRLQTGHGIPTLQSVMDCKMASAESKVKLIADGGIKTSGDIVKALAAGADFVMVGSLLAGTREAPGSLFHTETGPVKIYRGMASKEAQKDWKGKYSSNEGISTTIPYRGSVLNILSDLEKGITSGFSYSGVRNLLALQNRAKFVQQTNAGHKESRAHILERNE